MSVAHMHTHTHTHSCADMNSSHWCDSLWGLLPEWVLCWAGKWWWVNRSTPGSATPHLPAQPQIHTHAHAHQHYCSAVWIFPCLPTSWAPALPAGTFLLWPLSDFFVFTLFVSLFPLSLHLYYLVCLCYLLCCLHHWPAGLHRTQHGTQSVQQNSSCVQTLMKHFTFSDSHYYYKHRHYFIFSQYLNTTYTCQTNSLFTHVWARFVGNSNRKFLSWNYTFDTYLEDLCLQ